MEKSPDAFRTISEVADDLQLPQHVLRFWETRFVQIRPLKRAGGRRYYRPEDVDLLRRIRELLYNNGYTIKGVQRLLKDNGRRPEEGDVDDGLDEALTAAPAEVDGDDAEPVAARPTPQVVQSSKSAADPVVDAALAELGAIRDLLRKTGR
jgi:DNA-binding transcriptional MerR regulator